MQLDDLPPELVREVIARVQEFMLIRATCVNKFWNKETSTRCDVLLHKMGVRTHDFSDMKVEEMAVSDDLMTTKDFAYSVIVYNGAQVRFNLFDRSKAPLNVPFPIHEQSTVVDGEMPFRVNLGKVMMVSLEGERLAFVRALEEQVVSAAVRNKAKWFKRALEDDDVRRMFTSSVISTFSSHSLLSVHCDHYLRVKVVKARLCDVDDEAKCKRTQLKKIAPGRVLLTAKVLSVWLAPREYGIRFVAEKVVGIRE